MFSIRKEGEPFKSGFSFQGHLGKYPYVSAHYTAVDFSTDMVTRYSLRLRFKLWPFVLVKKTSYNFIENRLLVNDAVIVSRTWWEDSKNLWDAAEHRRQADLRKMEIINANSQCH